MNELIFKLGRYIVCIHTLHGHMVISKHASVYSHVFTISSPMIFPSDTSPCFRAFSAMFDSGGIPFGNVLHQDFRPSENHGAIGLDTHAKDNGQSPSLIVNR